MMQGGNRQCSNNHLATPDPRCNICSRHVPAWSITGAAAPGVCQGCGRTFCKTCGVPFLCRTCLDRLPDGKKRAVLEQHHKYKATLGGSIAMRIVGGMTAYYSFTYLMTSFDTLRYSSSTLYSSYINPLYVIAPSIFLAIGAILFFSGLIIRIVAKFPMQTAVIASLAARPAASTILAQARYGVEPDAGTILHHSPGNNQDIDAARTCIYCGKSLPPIENLRFCPGCGKKVEGKRFCMYCGNALPRIKDLRFCPACGKRDAAST